MKKAIKLRKERHGVGHIYRLEPSYTFKGKKYAHAVVRIYKAEVHFGFVGYPAGSLLLVATEREDGDGFGIGPKVLDIDNVALSEPAVLKKIGYLVSQ